jgi:dihydropyrimidinase
MENSCDILITNAKGVVIPEIGIVQTNILIESGRIKSLQHSTENIQAARTISADGKYVLPGVIDPHVHYGVYRPIEESAKTESASAAVGGVTTIMRMLRMSGSYKRIEKQLEASKNNHHVDYTIHASILHPSQLQEMPYLVTKIGISSFKIYMNLAGDLNHILMDLDPESFELYEGEVNMDDELLSSTIRSAKTLDSLTMIHAEDPLICAKYMNRAKEKKFENLTNLEIWSSSRPPISESISVTKATSFARQFHSDLYFVHIGSARALDTILEERQLGRTNGNLYIETCPHYLTHSTDFDNIVGKVVPPLRSKSDIDHMWSALCQGHIDTIGTDHVANRLSTKVGNGDIWSALAGFPGLATMIPVLLSYGVNKGRINLKTVAEVTSYNTSRIFGLYPRKGTIRPGSDADLVIVDLSLKKKISSDLLMSFSDYSIYDGWELEGWPDLTIVRGIVVMENGEVDKTTLGHGKFIRRPINDQK